MNEITSNERVAKNTIVLYVRMIVTMFIGIWTSRIIINALGFTDQGLYNLVGGFVGMYGLVTASVSYSISRFITLEIGRGDKDAINRMYRNANTVQLCLSVLVILLAETVGLWFMNYKLVIPPDRLFATHVVYQLSVFSMVMSMMSSPQTGLIIAHEKMNIYAGVAIITSILNLCIAFVIEFTSLDKLIIYAVLQFALSLGSRIFYICYSRKMFPFCKPGYSFDKSIFRSVFTFAGWNMLGSSAAILRASGTGVLLNLFGGPIANTINGIAQSANRLASIFVSDFTTAYNPQIFKKYALGEFSTLIPFVYRCSKFSFCLFAVMAVPVIINVEPLLVAWLKEIPNGTAIFAQLVIFCTLFGCLSQPLWTVRNAAGDIRNYQIVVGGIDLLTLPITYIFFKLGFPIYYAYISILITSAAALMARLIMLRGIIPCWSTWSFIKTVIFRCLLIMAIGLPLQYVLHAAMPSGILSVIVQCIMGFLIMSLLTLFVVCDTTEREHLICMLNKMLTKIGLRYGEKAYQN